MMHSLLVALCLLPGCAAAVLACVGVVRARGAAAGLHYVALASVVTPAFVAIAVWVEHGFGAAAVKATLVAGLLAAQSPLLAHVTGRAIYFRRQEDSPPNARHQ